MRIKNLLVAIILSVPFFSYALEGKGSEKDPYKVGSADDLDELSDMVNGWNGITPITKMIYVVQTADIEFNNDASGQRSFTPIGSSKYIGDRNVADSYFHGVYDGNGYTIKGLHVHKEKKALEESAVDSFLCGPCGLFGLMKESTVKNLTIEDAIIEGESNCGSIAGYANFSKIINCTAKNCTITKSGKFYNNNIGGICGRNNDVIDNCTFDGVVRGNLNVGGICGYSEKIKNCISKGSVIGSNIETYDEYGNVIDKQKKPETVGGIAGYAEGDINSCENYSKVTGYENAGGICAYAKDVSFSSCKNFGDISGNNCVAGIVATGDTYSDVTNCANYGDIIGENNSVGGIVGNSKFTMGLSYALEVSNSINYGKIKGKKYVGGIAGTTICKTCMNFGAVEGSEYVGGILGLGIPRTCINNSPVSGDTIVGAICGMTKCPNMYEKRVCYYNSDSCSLAGCSTVDCEYPVFFESLPTCKMVGVQALSSMTKLESNGEFYTLVDSSSKLYYYPNILALKGFVEPRGIALDWKFDSNGFDDEHGATEIPTLKGNTFEIANAGQLYWFANLINQTDTNCYYNAKLVKDIVVNENVFDQDGKLTKDSLNLRQWRPIGVSYKRSNDKKNDMTYQGVFDGQNHSIKGLYFNGDKAALVEDFNSGVGLFGVIKNGTIKNVNLVDCYFKCDDYVGGIACYANGSIIDSCSVYGYICTTNCLASGIAAGGAKRISNSTNHATVIQDQDYSDWLSGYGTHARHGVAGIGPADTIINCVNNGNILGYYGVSGIAQYSYEGVIINCENNADTIKGGMTASGICTEMTSATISNCVNNGAIYIYGGAAGGINAKSGVGCTISNCVNNGDIMCRMNGNDVGGIAGYSKANIYDCVNNGNIIGTDDKKNYEVASVGGIVGSDYYMMISNCVNKGSLIVPGGKYIGGMVGWATGGVLSNCINYGDVNGGDDAGGICGDFANNEDFSIEYCANYGNIKGSMWTGGISGSGFRGGVKNSYNRGDVTSKEMVGGLIGSINNVNVFDCYNTGHVEGTSRVGGLFGSVNMDTDTISNCYNIGRVSDKGYGTIGYTSDSYGNGLFENVYSNSDSCTSYICKYEGEIKIDSLSTMHMVGTDALSFMSGLDFENTWYVDPDNDGKYYFPHLLAFKDVTEAPYIDLKDYTDVAESHSPITLVYSVDNRIKYVSDNDTDVFVTSVDGKIIKFARCNRGVNDLGAFSRGVYVVNGKTVIVR